MTAHKHKMVSSGIVNDGSTFVEVASGWAVAPGDDDDLRVCSTFGWGSYYVVFADGSACGTSNNCSTYTGCRNISGNFNQLLVSFCYP
jgi:hypothetical protein